MSQFKPRVQLSDEDGNIFNLIGKASNALKQSGDIASAKQLESQVFECESYDEALNLISKYCEVE